MNALKKYISELRELERKCQPAVVNTGGVSIRAYPQEVMDAATELPRLLDLLSSMTKTLESCKAAMDYAYEDHADQYYLNVKNLIEATLETDPSTTLGKERD